MLYRSLQAEELEKWLVAGGGSSFLVARGARTDNGKFKVLLKV